MSGTRTVSKIIVIGEEETEWNNKARILKSMGYDFEYFSLDKFWPLNMMDHDGADIVILDTVLNSTDGLTLVKKIIGATPGQSLLVLSKNTQSYTYGDIIQAGAADFMAKPFEMSELKVKIERIAWQRNLMAKSRALKTALEVLLAQREQEHREATGKMLANMEGLILPCLKKLEATRLDEVQRIYVEMLKSGLVEISSPFRATLSQKHPDLSAMEMQVAKLIKVGRGNKEIAEILGISVNTVMTHRYRLRTKLGVKGKKVNLRSHFKSIDI